MATMLKINARLNFVDHSPFPSCSLKSGIFKPRNSPVPFRRMPFRMRENTRSRVERGTAVSCNMNHKPRILISRKPGAHGGIVCGQALMALADTAMVIAILAANRAYRPMTTVDQTTHFMRAVASSDVLADARVVRLGRTMSFGRVTLSSATDNKPVAMVSSAFAML